MTRLACGVLIGVDPARSSLSLGSANGVSTCYTNLVPDTVNNRLEIAIQAS